MNESRQTYKDKQVVMTILNAVYIVSKSSQTFLKYMVLKNILKEG